MNIPDGWQSVKLSDVVSDIQPGFAQRPNEKAVGTLQLRTNHVTPDGEIDLADPVYVNATEADLVKYGVKRGDVIFNNTNSLEWVGKTAYFNHKETYVLSNHMTRIRVDERVIDPEFLAKYLHHLWRNGISRRWAKHWVNQAAVDQSGLSNFQVIVPPLSEQRRIVSILREADELRRLRQETNMKAEAFLPSLFEEMFGQELARRKQWEIKKASQIGDIQYGLTVNSNRRSLANQYPYLRVANVYRGEFDLSEIATIGSSESDAQKFSLCSGDVLVVEGHADPKQIGRAAVWNAEIPNCLHQNHLLRIRPYSDQIFPNYLANFINSPAGITYMLRFAKTSSGLNTINSKVLSDMPIICPPLEQQQRFERIYSDYKQRLSEFDESKTKADELFRALTAKSFTGELTAEWREQNAELLAREAAERDQILGRLAHPKAPQPAPSIFPLKLIKLREGKAALSQKQRRVLAIAEKTDGYFTAERINEQFEMDERLALPDLQQTLQLLAELGLIASVRVATNPTTGAMIFSRAYRKLRTGQDEITDDSRLADLGELEATTDR